MAGAFDNDPVKSWTLPGQYYYDAEIYRHELERIFYRNWQYVCHVSRLREPGRFHVRDIGDQSVFVLRDGAGELRAYHNVCQHRTHRLLEGEGEIGQRIICPYHAWAYAQSGELLFARGSDAMEGFPRDEICLQAVKLDQLCGFIFVNLDPDAVSMRETFAGLEEEILALAPNATSLERAWVENFDLAANWKNSVENYAECYHCPNRHPSLVDAALDITRYKIHVHDSYHRHVTGDVGDSQGYDMDVSIQGGENFGSWLLWPNLVFEVYPGGNLTVFHHVPAGSERCLQETEWYFPRPEPSAAEKEVIDFVNAVRLEDIPICESVQRDCTAADIHAASLSSIPSEPTSASTRCTISSARCWTHSSDPRRRCAARAVRVGIDSGGGNIVPRSV